MALTVREYLTADGKSPFRAWLDSLTVAVRARIQARVLRFEMGNLGDHKSVGNVVWEARVMFGPGYRIYFGKDGNSIIVLLVGRQGVSGEGHFARARVLARLSGGEAAWQGEVKIGMSGWPRICGIRSLPGSSCWRRSMRACRCRLRLERSFEPWASRNSRQRSAWRAQTCCVRSTHVTIRRRKR